MRKFNDWLALKITNAVGSMWCAYIFTALALVSLPSAIESHSVITIVSWIAQTFLQLVLLSVILKGQNLQGERTDKVIEEIAKNTKKTEAAAKRIEHVVKLIEKQEEAELDAQGTNK
jgi:hypothetical protein